MLITRLRWGGRERNDCMGLSQNKASVENNNCGVTDEAEDAASTPHAGAVGAGTESGCTRATNSGGVRGRSGVFPDGRGAPMVNFPDCLVDECD